MNHLDHVGISGQIYFCSCLYCSGNLKDMTNLWEKEFLERFRKERSAQHPLRSAPNSCVRHRVERVNLAHRQIFHLKVSRKHLIIPKPVGTHRVHTAICAWQIQMDQAVGLRQKHIQALQTQKVQVSLSAAYMWSKVSLVSRWLVLSDRGILSRQDSWVFAQVQV